jgi:NAD-dependent deacetylase
MKIVFFTGSGISQESGIPTFRDRVGLWENFDSELLASKASWRTNKEQMLIFHNRLRRNVLASSPNAAHLYIAFLQAEHDVVVITQNVDDLHERAGSRTVLHLHGNLMESRSTTNPKLIYPCSEDLCIGDKCEKGSQLRPNVVWFGEDLDATLFKLAIGYVKTADLVIIIGTSLEVFPANTLVNYLSEECFRVVVDPQINSDLSLRGFKTLKLSAVQSVEPLKKIVDEMKIE